MSNIDGEVKHEYNIASMHNLASGILVSVTNSTQAPTRREKLEVAQIAAALAVVDVVNGLRADLADWRDAQDAQHTTD